MRKHAGVDGTLLHDAAIRGDVAMKHAQGANLGERVVMLAAHLAVGRLGAVGDVLGKRAHAGNRAFVEQAQLVELMHDNRHAAHGIQVDKRARARGLQLHQVRRASACRVPVVHGDGMAGCHGDSGQVQHRVGGAAKRHIAFHGVVNCRLRDDVLDANALFEQLHDLHACMLRQAQALGVHGGDGAVAGKRDAQSLAQAVHRIRGEHTRAAAARGTRGVFVVLELLFGHRAGAHLARAVEQGVQVGRGAAVATSFMAGKHGAARNEHRRNIHAQGTKHHAGNNLVAVGNAYGSVKLVALNSAFEAVGNGFAGNERVMHAIMVHGNAVAHADGGNLERNAAGHINASLHGFADFIEVIVTRNNVVAGIEHRDEGLLHFFIGKAVGLQQAAVGSTRHANFNGIATKLHRFFLLPSSVIASPRNAIDRRHFALDALSRKAPALHTDGGARWVFRVDQLRSASLLEGVFGAVHRRFSVRLLAVGWIRSYSPCRRIY